MDTLNEKELTILNSLNNFIPKIEDWDYNTYWTKFVKEILRDIGKKDRYKVYTCGIPDTNWGEYLYDLVWAEYSDSLNNILLVAEIEWKYDFETELQHDFEKLLFAQAELRLFVFQSRNDQIAKECFIYFDKIVDNFNLKQLGNRYLYICFSAESLKFLYHQKIV